jgi:hypothetical protein
MYIYKPIGLPCYSSPWAKSSCPHDVLNTKEEGKTRLAWSVTFRHEGKGFAWNNQTGLACAFRVHGIIIHTIENREWMDLCYRKLKVLTALSIDPTVGGTSISHNCYCLRLDYAREDQGLWCPQRKST